MQKLDSSVEARYLSEAAAAYGQNDLEKARRLLKKLLESSPAHSRANELAAYIELSAGNQEIGQSYLTKACADLNSSSEANYYLGSLLMQKGAFSEAVKFFEKAVHKDPQYFDANHDLGAALALLGRTAEALQSLLKALHLNPNSSELHFNLGRLYEELNQPNDAIGHYDKALALNDQYLEALLNKGVLLETLGNFELARACYMRAMEINPRHRDLWLNYSKLLIENKENLEALEAIDKSIDIDSQYAQAYSNKTFILNKLGRPDQALLAADQALGLNPSFAEAYVNKGISLRELWRYDEAIASYQKALSIKPDYAEAWSNQGAVFADLKRYDEAIASYQKALSIKPDYDFLEGMLLHLQISICDWTNYQEKVDSLLNKIKAEQRIVAPFTLLAISDDEAAHLVAAKIWADKKISSIESAPLSNEEKKREKIRIGYFSADFRNHPVAHLAAGLFESHDRQCFQTYAFSFGPAGEDQMRLRLKNAFDKFIDVSEKNAQQIAELARDLKIDIAVDLTGHTEHNRIEIFANRAAPIQINYLGYPGTMGASCYDYIIADRVLIPDSQQKFYSEKVINMPATYQPNDRKRAISSRKFSRAELGLPETGFIFGCFNNNFKITPTIFAAWMRLLSKVKGSVLWLFEDNPLAALNLKKQAAQHGIQPERLIFAGRMELSEHLSRLRQMDLFLDTLPYNAHTTASDALWCGVPVLTCIGKSFAGRVAASLISAIELPELITRSLGEYESKAFELASNQSALGAIRDKLESHRMGCSLFDTATYALELERIYKVVNGKYKI